MLKFRRIETRAIPAVIEIAGRDFPLAIKTHPRSRHIRLRTDSARQAVMITMPTYVSVTEALRFARSRSDWLLESLGRAGPVVRLEPGATIPFCGEPHLVVWREELPRGIMCRDARIELGGPRDLAGRRVARWLKAEARRILIEDLEHYRQYAQEPPLALALSNAARRWGSCSSRRAIRIQWRLIFAPEWVRRSVVAHEVAHLRHMNHSPEFYRWLDTLYEGDRKAADRWLKRHGPSLYAIDVQ